MKSSKVPLIKDLIRKLLLAAMFIIIICVVLNKEMEDKTYSSAMLTVGLIAVVAIYIIVDYFVEYRCKKKLLHENSEMSYIVQGLTGFYDKFILVDLDDNTYKYLAGASPEFLSVPPEGSYTEFLYNFKKMLVGYSEANRVFEELKPKNIKSKLRETDNNFFLEYFVQREDNQWERLNIICVKYIDGEAAQVLFARQNITEEKVKDFKREVALKEAYQAADTANRTKSDFLSRMSHDIRTPMNAIMGMTTIAEMNIEDKERVLDCLDKITVSSRHLLGFINEVLDMSNIESGKLVLTEEEFNLSETVENLITVYYPQIEKKRITLDVSVSNMKHEYVKGDAQRLQQVFVNIMGNAVKFTPEGGKVSMVINEKKSGRPGFGLYEFIFKDSGIGMEEDFINHIFEPFSWENSLKVGSLEGTGLGLAIAKNIVNMMKGDIQVKSIPGEGSEFSVTVCLQQWEDDNENYDKLADVSVLVVGDDEYECENICDILKWIRMNPDWVVDKDSAINKLVEANEKGEHYTAVILDWKKSKKNGLETAEEIRKKIGDDGPIIIMLAYGWSAIEQQARNAGVNEFISKPLFKSKLVHVMKSLLEKRDKAASQRAILKKSYEGKRVLLVEDNELNIEIAEEILKMAGFIVDTALDGAEAVKCVSTSKENYYDLIFMDIQMPIMDGYEATSAIRQLDRSDAKTIPIIAMSANAFSDDILKAEKSGMNAHVAKPIEISKLTDTIDAWLK